MWINRTYCPNSIQHTYTIFAKKFSFKIRILKTEKYRNLSHIKWSTEVTTEIVGNNSCTCESIHVNCMWLSASYKRCHLLLTPLVECASEIFFCTKTGAENLCSSNCQTLSNCDRSVRLLFSSFFVLEKMRICETAWNVLMGGLVGRLQLSERHSFSSFCCSCILYCVVVVHPMDTSAIFSSLLSGPNFGRAPRRKPTWASWSRNPTRNTWKQRKIAQATPMKATIRNIRRRRHAITMTAASSHCQHRLHLSSHLCIIH